jgi:3-oxoacyl-[acyl-carrier protein] reductase
MNDIDLDGRVVLVTGSSQNLGKTMAKGLAEAGARVVLASIDTDNLEQAADEIGRDVALPVTANITNAEDCQRIVDQAVATFGDLAVVVNNARYRPETRNNVSILEADVAYWQRAVHVNIFGTFLMTHKVLPHLMKRGWGRIINIATSLSTLQRKNYSPYGVTKTAIEAETVIWAQDLEGTGVTVNSMIPGGSCATERNSAAPNKQGANLLPPDVMNPLVVWLSSDLSDGYNGGRYVGKLWDNNLRPAEAGPKSIEPSIFRPASEAS